MVGTLGGGDGTNWSDAKNWAGLDSSGNLKLVNGQIVVGAIPDINPANLSADSNVKQVKIGNKNVTIDMANIGGEIITDNGSLNIGSTYLSVRPNTGFENGTSYSRDTKIKTLTVSSESGSYTSRIDAGIDPTDNVTTIYTPIKVNGDGSGSITLKSDVVTSGDQIYNAPVIVSGRGDNYIKTDAEGKITFNNTLKAGKDSKGADRPTNLNIETGEVTFNKSVGYDFKDFYAVGASATYYETIYGLTGDNFYSLNVTAPKINLNANVLTFETQRYNGNVVVGGGNPEDKYKIFLISTDPNITITGSINDQTANTHTLILRSLNLIGNDGTRATVPPTINVDRSLIGTESALAGYKETKGSISPNSLYVTKLKLGEPDTDFKTSFDLKWVEAAPDNKIKFVPTDKKSDDAFLSRAKGDSVDTGRVIQKNIEIITGDDIGKPAPQRPANDQGQSCTEDGRNGTQRCNKI